MNRTRKIVCSAALAAVLAATLMLLSGCGGGMSESDLKDILPETITKYQFEGIDCTPEITDISIASEEGDSSKKEVECDITLKDEYTERIVHADLKLTKDGEVWTVKSWKPYDDETIVSVVPPSESAVNEFMNGIGYTSIKAGKEDKSQVASGYYEKSFSVNESYDNVKFSGNAKYVANLYYVSARGDVPAKYSWDGEADMSEVDVDWIVEGTWAGSQADPAGQDQLPYKFDLTIDSLSKKDKIKGSGMYYFPDTNEKNGTGDYGTYALREIYAISEGSGPADAKLYIEARYGEKGDKGPTVNFEVTKDTISVYEKGKDGFVRMYQAAKQ